MKRMQLLPALVLVFLQSLLQTKATCSTMRVTDRIGILNFSTKSENNKNCRWIFQPTTKNDDNLVLILKFFILNQEPGDAEYLMLPNGEPISSLASAENYCITFVQQHTAANQCWRENNWSNCSIRAVNNTHWPPVLSYMAENINPVFDLEFELVYAYIDCFESNPTTTTITTDAFIFGTKHPNTNKLEASETHADSSWNFLITILIVIGTLSIIVISILALFLYFECRKKKRYHVKEKKVFQLEVATHAASTTNSENMPGNSVARSCDNIYEQLPNVPVNNGPQSYCSAVATETNGPELVPNMLYQI